MYYKFNIYQKKRWYDTPLNINTEVYLDNTTLLVNCSKKNELYNRKYGSYNWGYRKINISDIESIQTKNGYLYGVTEIVEFFMILILLLSSIIMLFINVFPIVEKYIYNVDTSIYISGSSFIAIPLLILIILGWISSFTFRSLKINVKDEPPIIFPYRKFWSTQKGSANYKYEDTENVKEFEKLISDLKNYNISLQIKSPKIDVKFLKAFLVFSVIMIIIGLLPLNMIEKYFSNKKLQREKAVIEEQEQIVKNRVISAIQNDECYVNVTFQKGKLVKRLDDYNIYNVIDTAEELKINEPASIQGGIYNIAVFDFYYKNTNEKITTEYVTEINNYNDEYNNWMVITKYNVHYRYNFPTKKLICFNIPNANLNAPYVTNNFSIGFYYKNKKVPDVWWISEIANINEICEFVYSNNNKQENEDKNYTYLERIGKYKSKYGWCFVIKGKTKELEKDLYFMYIHNNEVVSQDDFNGIVLSYTNADDKVIDVNTVIEYFKKIVCEI